MENRCAISKREKRRYGMSVTTVKWLVKDVLQAIKRERETCPCKCGRENGQLLRMVRVPKRLVNLGSLKERKNTCSFETVRHQNDSFLRREIYRAPGGFDGAGDDTTSLPAPRPFGKLGCIGPRYMPLLSEHAFFLWPRRSDSTVAFACTEAVADQIQPSPSLLMPPSDRVQLPFPLRSMFFVNEYNSRMSDHLSTLPSLVLDAARP